MAALMCACRTARGRYRQERSRPCLEVRGVGVVVRRVISPLIWVIIIVTLLITPLMTTHEPPSSGNTAPCLASREGHMEAQERHHFGCKCSVKKFTP